MGTDAMRAFEVAWIMLIGLWFLPAAVAQGQSAADLARAGCPQEVAGRARVGYGRNYVAYYVGGGAHTFKGELRHCDEGTFGVDYMPVVPGFRHSVMLGWWHGRRQQGGQGQYEPTRLVSPLPNRPRP